MEDVTADVGLEVLSEEGAAVEETDESEEDGEDGEEGEEIEAGSPPQPPRASAAARNSADAAPAIGVRFMKCRLLSYNYVRIISIMPIWPCVFIKIRSSLR